MVENRRIDRTQTRRNNAQDLRDQKVTNPEEALIATKKVRRQVYEGARMGLTWDELHIILDLPINFLRTHCRNDFVRGSYESSLKVCSSLYRMAVGTKKTKPNVTAAIFWLKARARWNDGSGASADPLANIDPDKPKTGGQSSAVLMLPLNGRESREVINEATVQALETQAGETTSEEIKDADEVIVVEGLDDDVHPESNAQVEKAQTEPNHSGPSGVSDSPLAQSFD